ncbi:unnamed protein product, partial [Iphiclides podalirius]
MALRLKKDIKKASYYVWFLGAQESRGLRGEEFALPAIRLLEERARDLEPFKVTLQVSHKGLKIIQNVTAKGKQQTIKHFIPHGSITSAVVQGDVVACVLLLYNPITGCPVHVHAYRCDSDHTAEMLYTHLQALIERPENQKKFADIERKLQMRGALPSKKPPDSSLGSEVSRESDSGSTEERCVANLYDSLAAELKQKLSTGKKGLGKSPILLPPRDYDTVHRQKGNLSNIDTRRCLNQNIVGVNARRKLESSGGSSGIGSDLAPSPERNDYTRQHDNHSTSEEDWAESTAYLMHEAFDASPPRRAQSPRRASPPRCASPPRRALSPRAYDRAPAYNEEFAEPYRDQLAPFRDATFERRFRHESLERVAKEKPDKFLEETPGYRRRYVADAKPSNRSIDRVEERRFGKLQRGASEGSLKLAETSPKDRFNVAKEKFMNLERERFNRELEQHMAMRRSMLERNSRSTSSPEEERRDERQERHRDISSRREPERSHRDIDRPREHREPERRKDVERVRDIDTTDVGHREIERLPRVGRKRDDPKRYEYGAEDYLSRVEPKPHRDEFDRYRERRELDRRIDEDEVIEPVMEDRRREWTDRQRAFSRSRLLDEQRQSYADGDRDRYYDREYREFRELADRQPTKFRHSYAEPIPRGRLGTVRPY